MFKLFFLFLFALPLLTSNSFAKSLDSPLYVEGEKSFSNIIVISKKFLRKTNKLEIFTYGATSINNAFYLNAAPGFDVTYYFREKYGFGVSYLYFFNSEKEIKKKLDGSNLQARIGFSPKQYVGAYFHWSPIYGKFALLNKKLIPFDLYFSLGLGQFSAEYRKKREDGSEDISPFKSLAFSFQAGQQFAWNSSMAVHWKVLWNIFPLPKDASVTGYSNNILFGLGISWFLGGETSR